MQKIAVIGLGRFGTTLSLSLSEKGAEVMAIDKNPERVEFIKDEVAFPTALDSTDIKALESQNIREFDICIVAIGADFESQILTTVNLLTLDVPHVIARAMNDTQRLILERMGIENIILPEVEMAEKLAETLLQPELKAFLKLADDYEIAEINAGSKLAGKSLSELDLRKRFNINVIAIQRNEEQEGKDLQKIKKRLLGVTNPEISLEKEDVLLVIGKEKDIKKFIDLYIQ